MINPENLRDCQCCWLESDECLYLREMDEWLCPDCYSHAEKVIKKLKS